MTPVIETQQAATQESTIEIIQAFIRDRFLYDRPGTELTPDLPLIEQRLIDSLQLMQLVQFLQERFGVWIDVTDLVPENFETINSMAALIDKQKQ